MNIETLIVESRLIQLELSESVKVPEPDFEALDFLLSELQARRVLLKMLETGEAAAREVDPIRIDAPVPSLPSGAREIR